LQVNIQLKIQDLPRKTKKVIIKEEKKDKDAFDMDSLQKVMKTLANEIVDVKGKLDEVSSKPFRPFFKKNPQIPPGGQTSEGVNVDEEEGEDEEEVQDTNLFWDINGIFDEDDTEESLATQTQSKIIPSTSRSSPPTNTSNTQPIENRPASKTLFVAKKINYDILEDMKKTRENISLYELSKLKSQKNSLLRDLGVSNKTIPSSSTTTNKDKISTVQTLSYDVWGVNGIIVRMDRWADTWPQPTQHHATTARTHSKHLIHAFNISIDVPLHSFLHRASYGNGAPARRGCKCDGLAS
jgi:hypothetical protein